MRRRFSISSLSSRPWNRQRKQQRRNTSFLPIIITAVMNQDPLSGPDPAVMEALERGNAVVFLDLAMGAADQSVPLGRIKLELFVKDVSRMKWSM
jgi:hypothetical protein